jgi:hypothetical protein
VRDDGIDVPLPRRYSERQRGYDEGMRRHADAIDRGAAAYLDPVTGLAVFTARFLADRNYCCDSGCRHCPYVPEG